MPSDGVDSRFYPRFPMPPHLLHQQIRFFIGFAILAFVAIVNAIVLLFGRYQIPQIFTVDV